MAESDDGIVNQLQADSDLPIARIHEAQIPIGLNADEIQEITPVAAEQLAQDFTYQGTDYQQTEHQDANSQDVNRQNANAQENHQNQDDDGGNVDGDTSADDRLYALTADTTGTPEMDEMPTDKVLTPQKPGVVQRLYDRWFNDGVSKAPRLKVQFYQTDDSGETIAIKSSEQKTEPYINIKAALEDITQESVLDATGSLARLRQTAKAAARAVGYYEVDLTIVRRSVGEVDVVIRDLGQPVRVDYRAIEVRGEGADNDAFVQAVDKIALQPGDVFDHGRYEVSKHLVEDASAEQGFFDGKWLDNSVDVVLPDNVADVNLVYDTGTQYDFDEVVFFTIDSATGQLTTDPDKLPVKPKILHQLLSFEMGDAYNRQAVRALSNDLLATGYFNIVNTEPVLPSSQPVAGIGFEQSSGSDDKIQITQDDFGEGDPLTQSIELDDGLIADIAPIEFSTSVVVKEKLDLVATKAHHLYEMPDDRVLAINTNEHKNRSILGRISDAVSNIAKAILPDEPESTALDLSDNAERPSLANRKSAEQVYQDKKVPLYVFVMTDKPRDAHIGIGWGSDTGTRLITKFEHNLINRSGYQAGTELRLSDDKKGVKLYATKPMSHPLNDKLQASLSYEEEVFGQSTGGFDLSARTLEQGLSRTIASKHGWNKTFSLRYRLDELETKASPDTWQDLPVNFVGGKPTQEAVLAGVAFHKTVADDTVSPMRGYRQFYSLEAGSDKLISDANMVIARAGLGGVYSFGDNAYGKNRAHQVVGSVQGGYIWSDNFNNVPYRLRFFAGGDQSIRGYNYNSLSPKSDKGYLLGGQALAIASAEYNYEIFQDLRLAVFGDVGNAYNKDFSNQTKIGAGVGVRWASPVGQVRVDVATGVKEEGNPIKLHFFIGAPF
ncbi:autotransporter assembly complex protein TamA [Moraxella marmotae]|uniref:autotransporter assembly complex protein TamA n=1 Tax=Moraxella marmotae TaxID=3344520 RepID=UPI0035F49716